MAKTRQQAEREFLRTAEFVNRSTMMPSPFRTSVRRLTRLCLGFSKKLDNLKHAIALHFAHIEKTAAGAIGSDWFARSRPTSNTVTEHYRFSLGRP